MFFSSPDIFLDYLCLCFFPQFTALKLSSLVHFPISQVLHLGPLPACHTATCDRSLIPVWSQWTQLRVIGKRQFLLSCKKCCGRSLGSPLSASRSILEPSLRGLKDTESHLWLLFLYPTLYIRVGRFSLPPATHSPASLYHCCHSIACKWRPPVSRGRIFLAEYCGFTPEQAFFQFLGLSAGQYFRYDNSTSTTPCCPASAMRCAWAELDYLNLLRPELGMHF